MTSLLRHSKPLLVGGAISSLLWLGACRAGTSSSPTGKTSELPAAVAPQAGGNGDPYNGPHFSGPSVPLYWDLILTTAALEDGVQFCLDEMNHRLLDLVFPYLYTVESKERKVRTWLEPDKRIGGVYRLWAETDWTISAWEDNAFHNYRFRYQYPIGAGFDGDIPKEVAQAPAPPFDLTIEPKDAKGTLRQWQVQFGLPVSFFLIPPKPFVDSKTGHLRKARLLDFYLAPSISIMDGLNDAATGTFTGATINLQEYIRCVEIEMYRVKPR